MHREVVCIKLDGVWSHGIHVGGVYKVTKVLPKDISITPDYMGDYYRLINDDGYKIWYHNNLFISTRKAKLTKLYETLQ